MTGHSEELSEDKRLERLLSEMTPSQRAIFDKYTIRSRRNQVILGIGGQSFTINYPCESKSHADWMRIQLAKALSQFLISEMSHIRRENNADKPGVGRGRYLRRTGKSDQS